MGLGGHVERARVRAPNRMVNVAYHIATISSTFLLWFTAAFKATGVMGRRERKWRKGAQHTQQCVI